MEVCKFGEGVTTHKASLWCLQSSFCCLLKCHSLHPPRFHFVYRFLASSFFFYKFIAYDVYICSFLLSVEIKGGGGGAVNLPQKSLLQKFPVFHHLKNIFLSSIYVGVEVFRTSHQVSGLAMYLKEKL